MGVELRDITMDDLPLYEALLTDPAMMSELGGPLPREGLEEKLQGIVDGVRAGTNWYSVVLADGVPAGTVCVWESEWEGRPASEIGWMVLPAFQGRGLATRAVRLILERADLEGRWGPIHAFPGVTNAASNAICRKTGFRFVGREGVTYAGRTLRCNHWVRRPARS
ncbi:MAG TPA: GNAT family N-acetyltransferase [Actinomycetota bacterium]|nr:GNAT family N-acetyltransferase [Actinomycetota bacterium]